MAVVVVVTEKNHSKASGNYGLAESCEFHGKTLIFVQNAMAVKS